MNKRTYFTTNLHLPHNIKFFTGFACYDVCLFISACRQHKLKFIFRLIKPKHLTGIFQEITRRFITFIRTYEYSKYNNKKSTVLKGFALYKIFQ